MFETNEGAIFPMQHKGLHLATHTQKVYRYQANLLGGLDKIDVTTTSAYDASLL